MKKNSNLLDAVNDIYKTKKYTEWDIRKARMYERKKILALLVDDKLSRQAQLVIDRRNSDPMCKTPYPREARWKNERNQLRAELRSQIRKMGEGV